jgi:hypothetical protein
LNASYRCCPAKPVHGFPPIGRLGTGCFDDSLRAELDLFERSDQGRPVLAVPQIVRGRVVSSKQAPAFIVDCEQF